MLLSTYDVEMIEKIKPLNCEAYLKNKMWRKVATVGVSASIWERYDLDSVSEVLVPLDDSLADYKSRIFDFLLSLQRIENRSIESIINDLLLSDFDVFRITAFKGDTKADLPLEDAATLIDKSLEILASASQSIISQQPYFQSRRPKEVEEFLKKLRMGHTERGSFIITLQVPIPPNFSTNAPLLPDMHPIISDEPFGRQVTARVCSLIPMALSIANAANKDLLEEAVPKGLNANFCEALADISDVCGERGAHFNMSWAPVRPIESLWNIKNTFNVKTEISNALREAGKILRTNMPELGIEVKGYVIRLDKENEQLNGKIKLNDISSDKPRIISMELDSEQYEKAIDAHKSGKVVTFTGNLYKSAKIQTLTDIASMIVSGEDEFEL